MDPQLRLRRHERLIVCRGPIRKEAIDVFVRWAMTKVGILLSERDSIVYPRALAPELRVLSPKHVHACTTTRVPQGRAREARAAVVDICREHGYRYVFAGYGFMAEDADFVRSIEQTVFTSWDPARTRRNRPA